MNLGWKIGLLIFTAWFTVEHIGRNLQGESIYRRPTGGNAGWALRRWMFDEIPGITRLLDRLEAKKLVCRERSASNRRQVFCHITEKGIALLQRLDPGVKRRAEAAVEMLDNDEVDRLLRSLERIRQGSSEG